MTPLPSEQKRRTRRAAPKPLQLDLPLDMAAAMTASIARFEVPPARSPAARAVAAETTMQNEARRTLAAKAEKSAKPKAAKPKARVLKP